MFWALSYLVWIAIMPSRIIEITSCRCHVDNYSRSSDFLSKARVFLDCVLTPDFLSVALC